MERAASAPASDEPPAVTRRAKADPPLVDHAEVAPWNHPQLEILRKAGKQCLWLLISEEEAHMLAAGYVSPRTESACRRMLMTLGEWVEAATTPAERGLCEEKQ